MVGRVRRMISALLGAILVTAGQSITTPPASAAPPPFVTVLFARSQWSVHERCNVLPGAITLERVASDLAARGGIGTGSVVTGQIRESAINCTAAALYPSWDMLRRLHIDHGWEATSHSATHRNITLLGREAQLAESCGTLPTFESHGFDRAWGLFSYPNNKRSVEIQTEVISTCFAYGRRYSPNPNSVARMAAPWWGNVRPVNGGACNVASAPCSTVDTRFRYQNPFAIANLVKVVAGQWAVVQFHKLVAGTKLSGVVRWDCSASDWRLHFTNRTEVYCWNDYQRILNAIPDAAIVTDPATVARAWGSNPRVLQLHP